ncbi:MAG: aldehyde dehydrogenase family protein [Mariprofundaceae bacterium]
MNPAPHFYLWINNKAQDGIASFQVCSPFNNKLVTTVSMAGDRHVEAAIKSSANAFADLRGMARHARAELLLRMVDGLGEAQTEIVDALVLEGGKPRAFALQEFERSLAVFSWAAEETRRFTGELLPMDGMARGEGYEGYTRREAIGPVFGICPFNFPLNLVAHKVAPAIAVGNPIIIKPATQTPISALIMARIATEAGAPAGSLNVLPMQHEQAALLLADERIKMVSFTGSPKVGWDMKGRIGKKRVALELGGNSGSIVDASADLDWAAARLALGGFAQAGQSCIAVQRIYVQRDVFKPFLIRLVAAAKETKAGDPREEDVVVGPVINNSAADRIMAWIDEAVGGGATLACGGRRLDMGVGNVIEPTVLTDVSTDMKVSCQEVFGPVITVTPFDAIDDAIAAINDSNFGLQAGVFTNDLTHAHHAIDALEVGGVVINDFPTYRVDHMPYGGVKHSGLGREGIRYTMLEMSEEKVVVIRKA